MERIRTKHHVIMILTAMFFALLLCGAASRPVKAETMKTETAHPDGILQNGDLLTEQEEISVDKRTQARSGADFEATVKAGLDNYQAANSENKVTIDVSACGVLGTEVEQKVTDFLNTHPSYFYVKNSFSYSYAGDNVYNLTFTLTDTPANVSKMLAAYDTEVNAIVKSMDTNWSALEKALYANDYLAVHCAYDSGLTKHSAYDAFVNKTAVCQGYALAFLELMDQANVNCELVTSQSLNHAWNLVNVNGSWYHVDTTWNDPLTDRLGRARHKYLLKSTNSFKSETGDPSHAADDYVYTGRQNDSTASDTSYDAYFWNSIDNPFGYSDGYWYGNNAGTITQYQGSASGLTESKEVKKLIEKWNVWNNDSGYWQSNYSGFSLYEDDIYYVLPTEVHRMSCDGTNDDVVYSLTEDERGVGYLYGFKISQYGDLTYGIAKSPNEETTNKDIDLCGHSYGNWITEAATCEGVGMRKQICAKCGKTQSEILPALGHSYQATSKIAATCTTAGCEIQTCGRCKDTKVTTIPATGHQRAKTSTAQPNFVKAGLQKTICADCGVTINQKALAKKQCKKGQTYTVGNYKYKIVSPKTNGTGTAAFAGVVKDQAKVTIGSKVNIQGASFKITQVSDKALKNKKKLTAAVVGTNISSIGKEAFSGAKKLKIITVKSKKLTKVGKNALKDIYKKAKIKVPSSKLKQYKKLFKSKGQKRTVKITK
ncbi:MAG: leucine-rich repeat protein [Firmicutes bacterium]|nr:leucine-rich repeat protein [Bacillota bacterium]NBI63657.1 hypothetical protein [Clostridiales bacterium]